MTAYIIACPKSKKALKELKGQHITVIEPTIFQGDVELTHPVSGVAIVGPSAYDRKWFAQIWTNDEGTLIKVT